MSVQETETFEEVYIKEEMIDAQQVNTTSTWSSSVCFGKCEENNENNNLKAEGVPANQFEAGSEHFNQVGEVVKIEDVPANQFGAGSEHFNQVGEVVKIEDVPANQFEAGSEHFNQVGEVVKIEDVPANQFEAGSEHFNQVGEVVKMEELTACQFEAGSEHFNQVDETLSIGETIPSGTGQHAELANKCASYDYRTSGKLKTQKQTHSGEKLYSCSKL
ncbi:uncharacterized protein LOC134821565 [Bolinopsis microptera]|uniref:uncharacterized protein LOC134821565 n=1 Tax=Bolinopsis microptera TaxID=2820187 RepID=UPI00307A2703